jgi:hypothetical protein
VYGFYLTPVKRQITIEDVISMFTRGCCVEGLVEAYLKFCFAMSKMAVSDEPKQYAKHFQMVFVEFLEFVGRISHLKFEKVVSAESTGMSLAWKIEQVLEEILP